MTEQKTTLRQQLVEWVEAYKDVAERNALAETPKESADYLLSLILKEVEGARLTKRESSKLDYEKIGASELYLEWLKDEESNLDYRYWKLLNAQLEAVKKILGKV